MAYNFDAQLNKGLAAEAELDKAFEANYHIEHSSGELQQFGIDRVFIDRACQARKTVEYKTDWRAVTTGNVFIETISVDTQGKLGWAYTSLAQILIYYVPQCGLACEVPMIEIKRMLPAWKLQYREVSVFNWSGYYTHGLLVPLAELIKLHGCQQHYIRPVTQGLARIVKL